MVSRHQGGAFPSGSQTLCRSREFLRLPGCRGAQFGNCSQSLVAFRWPPGRQLIRPQGSDSYMCLGVGVGGQRTGTLCPTFSLSQPLPSAVSGQRGQSTLPSLRILVCLGLQSRGPIGWKAASTVPEEAVTRLSRCRLEPHLSSMLSGLCTADTNRSTPATQGWGGPCCFGGAGGGGSLPEVLTPLLPQAGS